MIVKSLKDTDLSTIINCFLKAFENYFVPMPTNHEYYKSKWQASKVCFDLSYGMFDENELVGFIIHAVDYRNQKLVAYNTGTGVIPKYREKRIVQSIYDFALPDLKKNGIDKCLLEVIQENIIAIKSYKTIGFNINKNYRCFKGKIKNCNKVDFQLIEVPYNEVSWNELPNQQKYSWDNHKNSIRGLDLKFYKILVENEMQGFFVIKPTVGYVSQFEVLKDDAIYWNNLFSGISSVSEEIKINNVDELLKSKVHYLNLFGLMNHVNQYEMELDIT